jgi:hypothetical protein
MAQHVPGEVIVQFRAGTTPNRIGAILEATNTRIKKELGMPLNYLLGFSEDISVEEMTQRLKRFPEVQHAEPNRVHRLGPPPTLPPAKPR